MGWSVKKLKRGLSPMLRPLFAGESYHRSDGEGKRKDLTPVRDPGA